ncbi:MobA/MobL family protein [Sagittula stellata]|uniref:MobA/MobL family protein n=1 Tax=Sagittula stellata TaxID=52603 RepID=UPI0018DCEA8B|nr:MobA/MobL family protein [Sagittula stellata]
MSRCGRPLNDKIGRPQLLIVRRASGGNAVRTAAYNARAALTDARTGERFSYAWRTDCEAVEVIGWNGDAGSLWDAAEKAERKGNAQVARNIILPLPADIPLSEMKRLGREYSDWLHAEYGTASMVALHRPEEKIDPKTGETRSNGNWHIHVLETTRRVETGADGRTMLGEKTREMTDTNSAEKGGPSRSKAELRKRRDAWEDMTNAALARNGIVYRVDFSAYAEQVAEGRRAPQEPTEHLGPVLHKGRRDRKADRASPAPRKFAANLRRRKRNTTIARAVAAVLDDVMTVEDYAAAREEPADMAEDFFRAIWARLGKNRARAAARKRKEVEKARKATTAPSADPAEAEKERNRQAAITRRVNERREAPKGGTREKGLAAVMGAKDRQKRERARRRQIVK